MNKNVDETTTDILAQMNSDAVEALLAKPAPLPTGYWKRWRVAYSDDKNVVWRRFKTRRAALTFVGSLFRKGADMVTVSVVAARPKRRRGGAERRAGAQSPTGRNPDCYSDTPVSRAESDKNREVV